MNPPTEPVSMLTLRSRAGMLRQRTPQRLIAFSQTILVDFRSIFSTIKLKIQAI